MAQRDAAAERARPQQPAARRRRDRLIAVTGAGGQLGRALQSRVPEARFLSHRELDVTDRAAVAAALAGVDVVIHAAGLTNVDGCEADPERAAQVNVEGTRNVAETASAAGAKVVYLSTDYVFDGRKREPYEEDDPPGPLNVYGVTKLEGERLIAQDTANLIVRTSWVYGDGANFLRTILAAATKRDRLRVVDDQVGLPTAAEDLAGALVVLMPDATGVVHYAGGGKPCSWADLAEHALQEAGSGTVVERITTTAYVREAARKIAPRPAYSALSSRKAEDLGAETQEWRTAVTAYVAGLT